MCFQIQISLNIFQKKNFDTFESKWFWNLIQNLNLKDFRNKAFWSFFLKYGFDQIQI
jgi:hypothetical protein